MKEYLENRIEMLAYDIAMYDHGDTSAAVVGELVERLWRVWERHPAAIDRMERRRMLN